MKKAFTSKLAILIVTASLGATLPSIGFASPGFASPAIASPMEERIGVERFEPSRLRRASRKGTIELAAKKKKKKKASSSTKDESSTTPGETDASPSGGASDDDLQKAARVNPTPAPESSATDDASARSTKTSGKSTIKIESGGAKDRGPAAPVGRYLDLSVGGHAFSRSLSYHQQITPTLREYQPRLLGDATVSAIYYPAAQFTDGFVTNVGLDLNIEQAFAIKSRTPDNTTYPTQIHDYNGGLRVRVPLESLTPFLTLGYGDHAYKMSGANRAALILPDTDYKYLRAVVGAHVPLPSGVSVAASAGYRYVLSPGGIKTDYFPNLTVGGMEANLYIGYGLTSMIEARVGFDYRRYFYTMHSKNGDPYIVGGAIDQTYAGSLSIAVILGGADHVAVANSAEEAPPPPPASDSGDAPAPKRKKTKRPKMEDDAATSKE